VSDEGDDVKSCQGFSISLVIFDEPPTSCGPRERQFPRAVGWILAVYYFLNLFLLLIGLRKQTLFRIKNGVGPWDKPIKMIAAMSHAYFELRNETIHVPSLAQATSKAKELGVVWPPQAYVLLDSVTARFPSSWSPRL
jgi:hypothetical protein